MPVGRWVSRTAEPVLLTCCPPAPCARAHRRTRGLLDQRWVVPEQLLQRLEIVDLGREVAICLELAARPRVLSRELRGAPLVVPDRRVCERLVQLTQTPFERSRVK